MICLNLYDCWFSGAATQMLKCQQKQQKNVELNCDATKLRFILYFVSIFKFCKYILMFFSLFSLLSSSDPLVYQDPVVQN